MNNLSVREMRITDIDSIISYFLDSDHDFLKGMGVDVSKLPERTAWRELLVKQLELPLDKKEFYYIIWEVDGKAIGHSNVNKIQYAREAHMHLHMWNVEVRKKGMGIDLVRMSIPYYFKNLKLKKIYCEPYALNLAPNKVLPKVGFHFVKQHIIVPGWICFEQPVNLWELSEAHFIPG